MIPHPAENKGTQQSFTDTAICKTLIFIS